MNTTAGSSHQDRDPAPPRAGATDLTGLPDQLKALDDEQRRREAAPACALDTSQARQLLAQMAEGRPEPPAWVARRGEALRALEAELNRRLDPAITREDMALGLRRLEELAFQRLDFAEPEASVEEAAAFDEEFERLQGMAREMLAKSARLELMAVQAGAPVVPERHRVVGSEPTEDTALDGTIASQQAPGWTLRGEVLLAADVVRYASASGQAPGLPELDELEGSLLDESILGTRKDDTQPPC